MGWLFSRHWTTPTQVREHLNRERAAHLRLVDQAATHYGRHLWSLYEAPSGLRFIALDLIEPSADGDGYGYKDIDESMGPSYFDCPLRLLKQAGDPPPGGYAEGWRARVRAEAERRRRKLEPGQRFTLHGTAYTVTGKLAGSRSYQIARDSDGRPFRLGPGQIPLIDLT